MNGSKWSRLGRFSHNQLVRISNGGKTTNIHAVIDRLGNLLNLQLKAGNIYDGIVVVDFLSHVDIMQCNVLIC